MASDYPQLPPQGDGPRRVATVVNLAMQGKINATASLTLTPGATSTALSDPRIGSESFLALMPKTATAAAALGTTFVTACSAGSAIIAHTSAAAVDRSFTVLIIG